VRDDGENEETAPTAADCISCAGSAAYLVFAQSVVFVLGQALNLRRTM
jgi:hypothetical protein